jgi:diguanylate cyclase (GGDEF)-like protein
MLWTLTLTMGIYLLACAIQLDYMMVLLGRASHDPLTGALSRRSGIEAVDLLFEVSRRQNAPLSVLFLDVDDFKAINDTFGHYAGDLALKEITAKLNSVIRTGDVVIRWGGEEFIVLLTNTPMAAPRCNRIGKWLGSRPDGAPITASIGDAGAGRWRVRLVAVDRLAPTNACGVAKRWQGRLRQPGREYPHRGAPRRAKGLLDLQAGATSRHVDIGCGAGPAQTGAA